MVVMEKVMEMLVEGGKLLCGHTKKFSVVEAKASSPRMTHTEISHRFGLEIPDKERMIREGPSEDGRRMPGPYQIISSSH